MSSREILDLLKSHSAWVSPLIFILGLVVGSFLNVCIVRLPKEESVVRGRSHCPQCNHGIAWYDNIPLLSMLILGGRCRHCRQAISWRYPAVELLTAVCFLGLFNYYGLTAKFAVYTYFTASLLIATFVDFGHQLIPDEVSVMGALAGLVASYWIPGLHGEIDRRLALADSALGMLYGIGLIYVIAVLGRLIFKKESMGGGDLKLLAMIGTFLGPRETILAFFIAPIIAAPVGIILKYVKKVEVIAFGPYLSLAAVIALLWGDQLWFWFLPYSF
jgi:leader peptidase (prepilin peptidase)/N-methyltransferase